MTAVSKMNTRALDHLSYQQKIRHWMREDCWKPGGEQLRFSNPERPGFYARMSNGHIRSMPLLVGRPCFGILTAFLRYKDATKLVKGRGRQPDSRCGSCKLRVDCERVVRNRIHASPELKQAYDDWLLAEGPSSFGQPKWKGSQAERTWGRLCKVAFDVAFRSVNDEAVVEHYQKLDEAAAENERLRQRRLRDKQRREGQLDGAHFFDIQAAAAYRMDDIVDAMTKDDAPKYLEQLPFNSLIEMMDVWVCREFLHAAGTAKVTAAAIARFIVAMGWRNASSTIGALGTRVGRDLQRIERLEKLPWQGWVLLPPFDPKSEFAS